MGRTRCGIDNLVCNIVSVERNKVRIDTSRLHSVLVVAHERELGFAEARTDTSDADRCANQVMSSGGSERRDAVLGGAVDGAYNQDVRMVTWREATLRSRI